MFQGSNVHVCVWSRACNFYTYLGEPTLVIEVLLFCLCDGQTTKMDIARASAIRMAYLLVQIWTPHMCSVVSVCLQNGLYVCFCPSVPCRRRACVILRLRVGFSCTSASLSVVLPCPACLMFAWQTPHDWVGHSLSRHWFIRFTGGWR